MTAAADGQGRTSRVVVVVVTFDRREVLAECLAAVQGQTRPVDGVVVVDNGSSDGTSAWLAAEHPDVRVVRMLRNTGAAGGFAAGMAAALDLDPTWLWLFNDDDRPVDGALERLLVAARDEGAQLAGSWLRNGGEVVRHGSWWTTREVHDRPRPAGASYQVDLLCFSGTLVDAQLVRGIGVPRADYFMMFEEVEYCLRAKASGAKAVVVGEPLVEALHIGSVAGTSPPWRGYYQTRNQLRLALERRSAPELGWWAVRQARLAAGAVRTGDRAVERTRLRALGAWHGIRGRGGLTVTPR